MFTQCKLTLDQRPTALTRRSREGPPNSCAVWFPPRCALRRPLTSNVSHLAMYRSLAVLVLCLTFSLPSRADEAQSSSLEKCEKINEHILVIRLRSPAAGVRTLALNVSDNLFTFKGTTPHDLKWSVELDSVGSFSVAENSVLAAHFKTGSTMEFGRISNECAERLRGYLKQTGRVKIDG